MGFRSFSLFGVKRGRVLFFVVFVYDFFLEARGWCFYFGKIVLGGLVSYFGAYFNFINISLYFYVVFEVLEFFLFYSDGVRWLVVKCLGFEVIGFFR